MTYWYWNSAPKFTNIPADGKVSVMENSTQVIDLNACDDWNSEGKGLCYSISGGADAALFTIDSVTGVLSFKQAPDFENPLDYGKNNVYDVKVRVTDACGACNERPLWIMVTDKPEFKPASIGDKVFADTNRNGVQDAGELGVSGVKVTLTGAGADGVFGNSDDTTSVQTTDANGNYKFQGLTPGDYKVTFGNLPAGFEFTQANVGSNDAVDSDANSSTGTTDVIRLGSGEDNTTVDAGIAAKPSSIGDKVFNDANKNGIQDTGEAGVQGVKVTLTGAGADGVLGNGDDTTTTQVTDANGSYNFNGLNPGSYKVTFSNLPNGFEFTQADAGTNDNLDSDADPASGMSGVINLGPGESNTSVDAGVVAKPSSIGDQVFNDANGNGIQDAGEAGVQGVKVTLTGAGADGVLGNADDTTTTQVTDANGNYSFDGLGAGSYKVTFSDLPSGFEFTQADAGTNDNLDSDADPASGMSGVINLGPGESNTSVDAGVVAKPSSIGDKVFNDANKNGIQDAGEAGVQGVKVTLTGAGADGVLGNADDTTTTQVTDANGNYSFDSLGAGSYKVTFSDLPSGFDFTQANAGSDDAADSDADPTSGMTGVINLGPGEGNTSVDAGVVAKTGRLGDRVFNDVNRNGLQDTGEAGIAGVKVTLTGAGQDGVFGTGDDTTQTKRTTSKGLYSFSNLEAGQYKISVSELPSGFVFTNANAGNDTKDSDVDVNTGMTDAITLAPGQINNTIDAGAYLKDNGGGKSNIIGTPAPDTLVGNDDDNNIYGLGESDVLRGGGGNDCLFGAGGFDTMLGEIGNDVLDGGQQDDLLNGGSGKDTLLGAEGNDNLVGGTGNDVLNGSRDGINGANEVDTLTGGGDRDIFVLGNADSVFYSAGGNADYALIQDFNAALDQLQLRGSAADYETLKNGSNTELLYIGGGNKELIAVFNNTDVDISATSVKYV